MQYEIFKIPSKGDAAATEALNRFLRARRVISVHREFVADEANSFGNYAYGEGAVFYDGRRGC